MRPVDRGPAPRAYSAYGEAIGDLEERLGRYCSYCERRIPVNLAVEHVSPKSLDPTRETDWDNFLLGCTNCNSAKGAKPTNDTDFVWPDKDNTLRAFEYGTGGIVDPCERIGDGLKAKVVSTIELVGLDRHPGQSTDKKPGDRDRRWLDREEAWATATRMKANLVANDCPGMRDAITELAKASGFFGIWMQVFECDPDIRRRLIESMTGTSLECFDEDTSCVARPGGHL